MLNDIRIIPPNLNEKFRDVDFMADFKDAKFAFFCDLQFFLWDM